LDKVDFSNEDTGLIDNFDLSLLDSGEKSAKPLGKRWSLRDLFRKIFYKS